MRLLNQDMKCEQYLKKQTRKRPSQKNQNTKKYRARVLWCKDTDASSPSFKITWLSSFEFFNCFWLLNLQMLSFKWDKQSRLEAYFQGSLIVSRIYLYGTKVTGKQLGFSRPCSGFSNRKRSNLLTWYTRSTRCVIFFPLANITWHISNCITFFYRNRNYCLLKAFANCCSSHAQLLLPVCSDHISILWTEISSFSPFVGLLVLCRSPHSI